jgi:hypothetical protein
VQFGQSAQDERRDVLVAAVLGGAVLVLGDPDVDGAVEKTLDADTCLGAGEWGARALIGYTFDLVDRKGSSFTNGKYTTIRS